jgi:immune inhibitor A
LTGEIYPNWIQLDHSVAWYGWGNGPGSQQNADGNIPCDGIPSGRGFEFTIDIVNKLNEMDPEFDWAQYDVDGNGIVDHLMVIHAGVDNSANGGTYGNYQLWAHSWDVYCDNDEDGNLDYGCVVDNGGTPDDTSDDIMVANYTLIPEDADIGVVVHEYGHDIGLPDYYDTSGATSNSTAHWIVMSAGSWSGALGGSHPPPFNPWARYFFGWEEPMRVDYNTQKIVETIGQSEPTPTNKLDSLWIDLPVQEITVENLAGEGKGLHAIIGNRVFSTLTHEFDLSSTLSPTFSFSTSFAIEEDWDYTYIRASNDGENWDLLLNEEGVYATTDFNGSTAWLGAGGLTGEHTGILTYDLSAYAGLSSVWLQFAYVTDASVQDPGIWVDSFSLDDGNTNLYSNDLEDNSDWANDGWEEVPYQETFTHYYMLECRNDSGSIASVGHTHQYYSLAHDQEGWLVDKFSANVPGLLIWYRNNFYDNNQIIAGGRGFYSPATGPKGELLLVDSHYEPVVWSGGFWDTEADNPFDPFSNRRAAMDGALTLVDTPAWMIHDYANANNEIMDFGSRHAVSSFSDSNRSVPGWLYPGGNFVYPIDQASSVVIPAAGDYSTRVRYLDDTGTMPGEDATELWGLTIGGQVLGSGHPGSAGVQYGVEVKLVDQAEDGSTCTVEVWNSLQTEVMMNDVIIDFDSPNGIWGWLNNSSWAQMHEISAESMVTGDMDGNGQDEVVIDFGDQYGILVWMNNSSWAKMHEISAESMVTGDMDGNGLDEVIIDFGDQYGIWVRMNNSSWINMHSLSAESMVTGDMDGNGLDEVIIDFGNQYGLCG